MIWFENIFTQNPTMKILRFAREIFGRRQTLLFSTERLQKKLRDKHIKEIIQKLIGDLYFDDVTCFNNQKEGQQFYETVKSCLSRAGFELRKWVTYDEKLWQYFNSKESNDNLITSNTNQEVLGLTWCTENNTFVIDFKNLVTLAEDLKPTKQNILQTNAMFCDSIGLISPFILQFRLIFHKICTGKYDYHMGY